jgi:hypothetical protein
MTQPFDLKEGRRAMLGVREAAHRAQGRPSMAREAAASP